MKILTNIFLIFLATTLSCCSCVQDLSTTGEGGITKNDNTYAPTVVRAAMDSQQKKVINFFFEGADKTTGMALNSSNDKTTLTTGATGFGIMNLIIGAERGWIAKEDALGQILKIARFLKTADRYKGAWAHWYTSDGKIKPFGNQNAAGEIVETAFMMGGLLTACEYFNGNSAEELELQSTTKEFWNAIEWNGFIKDNTLYWMWHSDTDTYELPLRGWNETLLVYILGLAAPDNHKIPVNVYESCWQHGGNTNFSNPGRKTYGYPLPLGGDKYGKALFLSQYSFLGLNPKLMQDKYAYYWTQNQSHTMINRHYCIYESPADNKFDAANWGLTACEGCGTTPEYLSREPFWNDDGVIPPTAAISAFPYTPFYSTQVLLNLHKNYPALDGKYGFYASYKPKEKAVSKNYLGMEHAPMAIMMENYRSGLIWNLLMGNEHIQKGLRLAGISTPSYTPGFYSAVVNTETGVYDMMRHPDRENYEIDLYTTGAGKGKLFINTTTGENIYTKDIDLVSGTNVIPFFERSITRGKKYELTIIDGASNVYTIPVILR